MAYGVFLFCLLAPLCTSCVLGMRDILSIGLDFI